MKQLLVILGVAFIVTVGGIGFRAALAEANSSGQRSWTLVYANNAAGERIAGNIDKLIRAVRDGQSVKVVLERTEAFPGEPPLTDTYVYSFEAHTLHVRNGVVFATNTQDVGTRFVGDDLRFQEDSYYYMIIADTQGVLEQIRWSVGEHTMRGHDQGNWFNMKWFVH
jgi:hypothetical protein